MNPTPELLKRIRMDKLEQARRMHPIERLLAGPMLHDLVIERMRVGLHLTHPDASAEEIREIIRERIARQRERGEQRWTA